MSTFYSSNYKSEFRVQNFAVIGIVARWDGVKWINMVPSRASLDAVARGVAPEYMDALREFEEESIRRDGQVDLSLRQVLTRTEPGRTRLVN
jgi:hypothetical protein